MAKDKLALLEAATTLENAGQIDEVSFRLTRSVDFDTYEAVGRMLGRFKRATSWWIGDWLLFGQQTMGERFAQAAEATGLSEGTLSSYMRVCEMIPRQKRKVGVPFSVHEEVCGLEPAERDRWLTRAAKESLSVRDLRAKLRDDGSEDKPEPIADGVPHTSKRVRLREVAIAIFHHAQPVGDGTYIVPGELYAQLRAVIGEED